MVPGCAVWGAAAGGTKGGRPARGRVRGRGGGRRRWRAVKCGQRHSQAAAAAEAAAAGGPGIQWGLCRSVFNRPLWGMAACSALPPEEMCGQGAQQAGLAGLGEGEIPPHLAG